ncbi:MAG: hypothetical protein KatS3mg129_2303 [Leptospiraceae bacterium]|nr:MAG: hypothetical protein KatS3mg129_2303 [Leptospiraceae bacterium]
MYKDIIKKYIIEVLVILCMIGCGDYANSVGDCEAGTRLGFPFFLPANNGKNEREYNAEEEQFQKEYIFYLIYLSEFDCTIDYGSRK